MQQIEILRPRQRVCDADRTFPGIIFLRGREGDATAAAVRRRIDDFEGNPERGEDTRSNHPEIVIRSLIGPAAPAVVWFLITESAVGSRPQINGASFRQINADVQVQCGILQLSPRRFRTDPDQKTVDPPFAVILNEKSKAA